MTKEERMTVWAKKDELRLALDVIPDTAEYKKQRQQIAVDIKHCNNQLVQDKLIFNEVDTNQQA